jgi:hypothetical protein
MSRPHLNGRIILVVEVEPFIVMDIANAFTGTGAHLKTTTTLRVARQLVEYEGLSAAILGRALSDGDSSSLCTRLEELGIPFLMYSGFPSLDGPCKDAPHLSEPASHRQLVDAVEALIRDNKAPN